MPELVPCCPSAGRRVDRWSAFAVLALSVVLAAQLLAGHWSHAEQAWWSMTHDRHQHYLFGLNLAVDVQQFDFVRLRHDLNAMRVWGPLYGLLGFCVQLPLGPNFRLAALPSLGGFVLTLWAAFLVVRRMLPAHGNLAGFAAAAVLAAVPAFRVFATEAMLESLGLGLTLLCLYYYLVAVQGESRGGVGLALSLIAMFFLKYNYWLIVVIGLVAAEFVRQPAAWLAARSWAVPALLREARQPLGWIAALLFGVACWVWVRPGTTISLGSRSFALQHPHNLFTVGFAFLFLRLCIWWRQQGRVLADQLDQRVRPVLVWHGWVTAFWFLLPGRLGFFLWYLSPGNCDREFKSGSLVTGFHYYLGALREDYCPWAWQLGALLMLAALAVTLTRRLRPGSVAVVLVFAVGAILTMQHAMTKHRHAFTWAGIGWVLACVGLFGAIALLLRGRAATWAAATAALLIVGLHAPAYRGPGHAQEAGCKPGYAQALRIPASFLPELADATHSTILSNVGSRQLFAWTFLEAHGHGRFRTDIPRYKEQYEGDQAAAARWLEQTESDALVLVEVRPGSVYTGEMNRDSIDLATMNQALSAQEVFHCVKRCELPDSVAVAVWRRETTTNARARR